MAVFRVSKNQNYTVMSNTHLKDMSLSLAAKGLLSLILSLPDDWDYSLDGLCSICREKETAVNTALKELKTHGYVVVTKLNPSQTKSGRFEYIYNVYENPVDVDNFVDNPVDKQEVEKQDLEKQGVEILGVEKLGLEILDLENLGLNKVLNNQVLNNQVLNTNITTTTKKEKDEPIEIEDIPTNKSELAKAAELINRLVGMYWCRKSTEFDTQHGFRWTYRPWWTDDDEPMALYDSTKAALLEEAFKASAMSQQSQNWRYVDTVMDDWTMRGIHTPEELHEAEQQRKGVQSW